MLSCEHLPPADDCVKVFPSVPPQAPLLLKELTVGVRGAAQLRPPLWHLSHRSHTPGDCSPVAQLSFLLMTPSGQQRTLTWETGMNWEAALSLSC